MKKVNIALIVLIMMLSTVDWYATVYGVQHGYIIEVNPVLVDWVHTPYKFLLLKSSLTLLCLYLLRKQVALLAMISGIYVGVTIWHVSCILKVINIL